jgi:hypothetical protein
MFSNDFMYMPWALWDIIIQFSFNFDTLVSFLLKYEVTSQKELLTLIQIIPVKSFSSFFTNESFHKEIMFKEFSLAKSFSNYSLPTREPSTLVIGISGIVDIGFIAAL